MCTTIDQSTSLCLLFLPNATTLNCQYEAMTLSVYMDDIMIHTKPHPGETEQQHKQLIHHILEKLEKYDLYVKLEKCKFLREIEYLGVIVRNRTLKMNPKKLESVKNWATPTNPTKIWKFLGFLDTTDPSCYGHGLLIIVLLYENAPGLIWGYHYVNISVFTCILIASWSSRLMSHTGDFNGWWERFWSASDLCTVQGTVYCTRRHPWLLGDILYTLYCTWQCHIGHTCI